MSPPARHVGHNTIVVVYRAIRVEAGFVRPSALWHLATMGLTDFVAGVADKLGSTIDKAQSYAADTIISVAQPAVLSEIDQRVDSFRDAALSELPRQTEEGLQSKVENGPAAVTWLFNKVRCNLRLCSHAQLSDSWYCMRHAFST